MRMDHRRRISKLQFHGQPFQQHLLRLELLQPIPQRTAQARIGLWGRLLLRSPRAFDNLLAGQCLARAMAQQSIPRPL